MASNWPRKSRVGPRGRRRARAPAPSPGAPGTPARAHQSQVVEQLIVQHRVLGEPVGGELHRNSTPGAILASTGPSRSCSPAFPSTTSCQWTAKNCSARSALETPRSASRSAAQPPRRGHDQHAVDVDHQGLEPSHVTHPSGCFPAIDLMVRCELRALRLVKDGLFGRAAPQRAFGASAESPKQNGRHEFYGAVWPPLILRLALHQPRRPPDPHQQPIRPATPNS